MWWVAASLHEGTGRWFGGTAVHLGTCSMCLRSHVGLQPAGGQNKFFARFSIRLFDRDVHRVHKSSGTQGMLCIEL